MAVLLVFWLIVVIICISLPFSVSSVNYCGAKMCEQPNSHTLCKYTPGPSSRCNGYIKADLSPEEKARILARMNRRRSEAAAGLSRNLPPAADMLKLRWVEELAREAQLWADQCRPIQTPEEKDDCRDLYSTTVGQCIVTVVGEAPGLKAASMVDVWYLQSLKYRWNTTQDPPPFNSYEFADFTQMLWAKAYMVGCARTRFMAPWRGHLRRMERLVCNFAPRGPGGAPPWSPGAPASACPPHSTYDRDLPSLCSYHSSFANSPYTQGIDGEIKAEDILLKTLLEIEQNGTLDYMGSLDDFFLTKLAIATITTTDNNLRSTPMHFMDLSNKVANAKYNRAKDLFDAHEKYTSARRIENKSATKFSFVGRPKTYNIDELSHIGDKKSDENLHRKRYREEKYGVVVDRDLYMDYVNDISRTDPDNPENDSEMAQTNLEIAESLTDESAVQDFVRHYETKHPTSNTASEEAVEYLPLSSPEIAPKQDENNVKYSHVTEVPIVLTMSGTYSPETDDINIRVPLLHALNKTEEEYLSDPETVREIQAALDKMENELTESMTLPTLPPLPPLLSQGKVRRDLRYRRVQDDRLSDEPPASDDDRIPRSTAEILKKKNITDEGPIYRMMQHYVPYLSKYKDSFTGDANSSSSSICLVTTLACLVTLALTF